MQYTLGFSLSPQVHLTNNGKAYNGTTSPAMNIQPGKMQEYADFLAEVTKHFGFDYLSPVNEPQWKWGDGNKANQEGTQATNDQVADLSKRTAQKLAGSNAQIVVGESGTLEFLYAKNEDMRGDQIRQFFSPSSPYYLGNTPNIAKIISGHSYFTTCPDNNLVSVRQQAASMAAKRTPGCSSGKRNSVSWAIFAASTTDRPATPASITGCTWQSCCTTTSPCWALPAGSGGWP